MLTFYLSYWKLFSHNLRRDKHMGSHTFNPRSLSHTSYSRILVHYYPNFYIKMFGTLVKPNLTFSTNKVGRFSVGSSMFTFAELGFVNAAPTLGYTPKAAFWNLIPLHSVSFQPSDIHNIRATARNFSIEQLMFKINAIHPTSEEVAFSPKSCKVDGIE